MGRKYATFERSGVVICLIDNPELQNPLCIQLIARSRIKSVPFKNRPKGIQENLIVDRQKNGFVGYRSVVEWDERIQPVANTVPERLRTVAEGKPSLLYPIPMFKFQPGEVLIDNELLPQPIFGIERTRRQILIIIRSVSPSGNHQGEIPINIVAYTAFQLIIEILTERRIAASLDFSKTAPFFFAPRQLDRTDKPRSPGRGRGKRRLSKSMAEGVN